MIEVVNSENNAAINIAGRHINVSDKFKDTAVEGINKIMSKYNLSFTDAQVTLSKNNFSFHTDINIHINKNLNLRVSGEGIDAYICIQVALETLELKIRKYKKRLTDHHRHHDTHHEELDYKILGFSDQNAEQDYSELAPTTVAEIKSSIPTICVSDAIIRFDLSDENAFIFRNVSNKEINVLYRRKDGNIGWIDPPSSIIQ